MRYLFFLIINGCFIFNCSAQQNKIPIDTIIAASKYKGAALSPDEKNYYKIALEGDRYLIEIHSNPFLNDEIKQEYLLPTERLSGIAWINKDEIVFSSTVIEKKSNGKKVGFKREWFLLNIIEQKIHNFLSYPINLMVANQPATLVHVIPEDPSHILISYPKKKGIYPSVFKVNVDTGNAVEIIKSQNPITTWMVNSKGEILMGYGNIKGKTKLLVRNANSGILQDISEKPLFKQGYFTPLKQGISDGKMFVSSAIGQGRKKIYHYDYDKNIIISKVFEHPKVDTEDIIFSYDKNRIVAATYIEDSFEYEFFDDDFEALYSKIVEKIPHKKIRIIQDNEKGDFTIILAETETKPHDFFIYSKNDHAIKPLINNSTVLSAYEMASVKPVTYFSRDGLEIHSYLTMPHNSKGPLPTIIMPHGGPWVRDSLRYHDWAQFLANRGFVVLQPNFRGSTGYGNIFTNISIGEWGGKMQDDLTDGLKWLERQGIADPDRVCIVGGSYGGYAALMGAIKDPNLYKCAVSFAPVTDLNTYINMYKNYPDRERLKNMVAGSNGKRFFSEKSPSKQAKSIEIPILLVHGNSDIRVDIKHSQLMIRSLKKAKKNFEFIELDGASHFLLQDEHKKILFEKMEAFLEKNIKNNDSIHSTP